MHVALRIIVHYSPLLSIVVHCCPLLSNFVQCYPLLSIRVFHKNTFSREQIGHTLTCPSGAYINQIQKLFSFGQV